jgi:hypothetical protein
MLLALGNVAGLFEAVKQQTVCKSSTQLLRRPLTMLLLLAIHFGCLRLACRIYVYAFKTDTAANTHSNSIVFIAFAKPLNSGDKRVLVEQTNICCIWLTA